MRVGRQWQLGRVRRLSDHAPFTLVRFRQKLTQSHPRRVLPARRGGLRRRGRLALGPGIVRLSLGLARSGAYVTCARNGTTVRV